MKIKLLANPKQTNSASTASALFTTNESVYTDHLKPVTGPNYRNPSKKGFAGKERKEVETILLQ